MEVIYKTTIVQTGNNTGIHVPETILEKLNGGKKPLVKVTLNATFTAVQSEKWVTNL